MDHRVGKTSIVETLLFGEDGRIVIFEVDVFPPKPLSSFITLISQYLRTSYTGIREEIDECAVRAGGQRDNRVSGPCGSAFSGQFCVV